MPGLLIVYGTSEGQTRKIARRMAERRPSGATGWRFTMPPRCRRA
jgi:hypothetical protein